MVSGPDTVLIFWRLTQTDGHVSRRDQQAVVTASAYILFYRRRSEHPLGGAKIMEMMQQLEDKADSEAALSREPSPSATGEGRRLGDSSRSGLSGPSGAGPVHQAGVGGLGSPIRSHEASADDESRLMPMSMQTSDPVDEGIGEELTGGPDGWGGLSRPGWGFDLLQSSQPNNSDNDNDEMDGGSQDSTRVEGGIASRRGSLDEADAPMFSDSIHMADEDTRMRGVRESAPPPDIQVTTTPIGEDDDDDELPVAELVPDEDGVHVKYAQK
jgi:ubiquitin carboxyl-terminal hydrolase 4/11